MLGCQTDSSHANYCSGHNPTLDAMLSSGVNRAKIWPKCFPFTSNLCLSISEELALTKQVPCGTALRSDPLRLTNGDRYSNLASSSGSTFLLLN